MDNRPSHQPDGNIPSSRSRMLGLDGMLRSGPSRSAYSSQNRQNRHAPSQYQSTYVSLADQMHGHGRSYNSPYSSARHSNRRHSPRSQTSSRQSQAGQLPELPPFPGTESGYRRLRDTAQRPNANHPYLPPYYHSAPQYRPDYIMSHGPPGTYNPYLPHTPQPPLAVVSDQYFPPGPNLQNNLPSPNISGSLSDLPPFTGNPGTQMPYLGPPQASSNVSPPPKTCSLCLEKMDPKPSNFPFRCPQCTSAQYCSTCLKSWFLDACKNESKMPPKCCSIIPLSAVKKIMTVKETTLYKAKLEEWMTPSKLYCPVLICSTFVPPRLFQKPAKKSLVPVENATVDGGQSMEADSQAQPRTEVKVNVACPKCSTQVCTHCRSFAHDGACGNDLDPALAEQLKKWKIKRCPRCRTGVRKVYGCSHIECRCGAHFCWECMQPVDECEGDCDDDARDESGIESDDVDGLAGYYDGDGHEFGPEPESDFTVGWHCQHILSALGYAVLEEAECHRCFRNIVESAQDASEKAQVPNEELKANGEEVGHEGDAQLAWQCVRCTMVFCRDCRELVEEE